MENKEIYERLVIGFEKYFNHKFGLFESVICFTRSRCKPDEFEIVPHLHWYYSEEYDRYRMYDPTIKFYARNVMPMLGNECLIGFKGSVKELNNVRDEMIEKGLIEKR